MLWVAAYPDKLEQDGERVSAHEYLGLKNRDPYTRYELMQLVRTHLRMTAASHPTTPPLALPPRPPCSGQRLLRCMHPPHTGADDAVVAAGRTERRMPPVGALQGTRWASPSSYGLIQKEHPLWTLDEVVNLLKRSYCATIGWELNHILPQEETAWLHQHIEDPRAFMPTASKRAILKRLMVRATRLASSLIGSLNSANW